MNTKYRKNLKDVATACKNYTDQKIDEKINELKWYLGSYDLSKSTYSDVVYTKTLPIGSIGCKLDEIGGMSYKVLNDMTQEYELRNSPVTSVISKDSNNTIVDTFIIPAEVQALDDYGCGINDNCYNYIDFETKKFVQKVGKYTFTGNESWSAYGSGWLVDNVLNPIANTYTASTTPTEIINDLGYSTTARNIIQSSGGNNISINGSTIIIGNKDNLTGKTIYYELATPVETDISEYIEDNIIEVEPNGTLTYTNTYEQAVPGTVTCLIEMVKSNE